MACFRLIRGFVRRNLPRHSFIPTTTKLLLNQRFAVLPSPTSIDAVFKGLESSRLGHQTGGPLTDAEDACQVALGDPVGRRIGNCRFHGDHLFTKLRC